MRGGRANATTPNAINRLFRRTKKASRPSTPAAIAARRLPFRARIAKRAAAYTKPADEISLSP